MRHLPRTFAQSAIVVFGGEPGLFPADDATLNHGDFVRAGVKELLRGRSRSFPKTAIQNRSLADRELFWV